MEKTKQVYSEKPKKGDPWDIAIIGSGPSGLTSAIYTSRGAASTLILAGDKWGGQLMLTTEVDNFPTQPGIQGPELMQKMRDHATSFGAEFIGANVSEIIFAKTPYELKVGDIIYKANSVIIATGSETRWLGVPGEEKLRGRGVSSCAPCDAPFFKDKNVAVIGGGDSAMEEALVLTKYASNVVLVHRRDEFRASAAMQSQILDAQKNGKVKVVWDTEVVELIGDQFLQNVLLKTKEGSEQASKLKGDELSNVNGKVKEEKEGHVYWEMSVDGVFVAIGHIPATNIFKGKVELDEKGYIKKLPNDRFSMSTSVEGVFVAGDVHDYHFRQAITAAGFGCMAGMEALKYLDKSGPNY